LFFVGHHGAQLDEESLRNSRIAALNLMEDADEERRKSEQASIALREKQEILNLFVKHDPSAGRHVFVSRHEISCLQ